MGSNSRRPARSRRRGGALVGALAAAAALILAPTPTPSPAPGRGDDPPPAATAAVSTLAVDPPEPAAVAAGGRGPSRRAPASPASVAASVAAVASVVSGARAPMAPVPVGPGGDIPAAEPFTGQAVGSTVGQLLSQDGGRQRQCSATVVASQTKSVIVSAGHCVYTPPRVAGATIAPPGQQGWVEATRFVPGVDGAAAPFGVWEVEQIAVDPRWQTDGDPVHDVAFLRLAARDGQLAGDVLGAQGIGEAPDQPPGPLSAVGYPAAGGFTGDEVLRCAAEQPGVEAQLGGDYTIPCDMTEGSSGGPWLADLDENTGLGVVQAVTSLRVVGDERIAGARLGPDAMALFAAVDERALDQPDQASPPEQVAQPGHDAQAGRSMPGDPATQDGAEVAARWSGPQDGQ